MKNENPLYTLTKEKVKEEVIDIWKAQTHPTLEKRTEFIYEALLKWTENKKENNLFLLTLLKELNETEPVEKEHKKEILVILEKAIRENTNIFKQSVKILSTEEIEAMSIKEIEDITKKYKEIRIDAIRIYENSDILVDWMIRNHDRITNFEEKFILIINHNKTYDVELSNTFVAMACKYVKEEPLRILLESGWDPNYKTEHGLNAALYTLFHNEQEKIYEYTNRIDVLEEKQKRLLQYLIRFGIDIDIFKEKGFFRSLYRTLTPKNQENYFKWLHFFKEEMNDTQKRQWNAFRLKYLI